MYALIEAAVREFDTLDRAVIVTDLTGTIVFWSRGAEELLGWKSDEVLGRHVLGVTPTNESMPDAARIMSSLQVGRSWEGSFWVQTKSRESVLVQVKNLPLQDERGSLVGIVGVSRRIPSERTPDEK